MRVVKEDENNNAVPIESTHFRFNRRPITQLGSPSLGDDINNDDSGVNFGQVGQYRAEITKMKLYDHDIAREIYFSRLAGSLRRRIRPCCSQFYTNMVILGESPPFEGKLP